MFGKRLELVNVDIEAKTESPCLFHTSHRSVLVFSNAIMNKAMTMPLAHLTTFAKAHGM